MPHAIQHRLTLTGALLMALAWPLAGQASAQLASDKGCYNCHGAHLRGDAPAFERLSSGLAKYKGDPTAEARFLDKYRAGEFMTHIGAHERLSPESARALVHWLIEGGK